MVPALVAGTFSSPTFRPDLEKLLKQDFTKVLPEAGALKDRLKEQQDQGKETLKKTLEKGILGQKQVPPEAPKEGSSQREKPKTPRKWQENFSRAFHLVNNHVIALLQAAFLSGQFSEISQALNFNREDLPTSADLCRRLPIQSFRAALIRHQILGLDPTRLDVQVALRERNLDAVFFELAVDALVEAITQDHDKFRRGDENPQIKVERALTVLHKNHRWRRIFHDIRVFAGDLYQNLADLFDIAAVCHPDADDQPVDGIPAGPIGHLSGDQTAIGQDHFLAIEI